MPHTLLSAIALALLYLDVYIRFMKIVCRHFIMSSCHSYCHCCCHGCCHSFLSHLHGCILYLFIFWPRAHHVFSLFIYFTVAFLCTHTNIHENVCCCHHCANVLLVASAFTDSLAPTEHTFGCRAASRRADWNSRITWNGFFLSAIALVAILVIHKVNSYSLLSVLVAKLRCYHIQWHAASPRAHFPAAKWHFVRRMPLVLIYILFFVFFFCLHLLWKFLLRSHFTWNFSGFDGGIVIGTEIVGDWLWRGDKWWKIKLCV